MKPLACLALLATFSVAQADPDARAALALAGASVPTPTAKPPCNCDGCICGCAEGKPCTCAHTHHTEGEKCGAWTWTNEEGGYWWRAAPAVEPLPMRDYSRAWQSQPQFFAPQMQRNFGGGGGRSGGC